MSHATQVTVLAFSILAGLAGIEHGIGEIVQGNIRPAGIVIKSWPDSELFRILDGEPAMTLIPDLRLSGILTIIVSLVFIAGATLCLLWFCNDRRSVGPGVVCACRLALFPVGTSWPERTSSRV